MGKIPGGILGKVQGKVGGVIGQSWKGIGYIRSYFIPANPQTAGQQSQRSKMTICVYVARLILSTVIQPFWNPFASGKSGYNDFVAHNIKLVDDSTDFVSLEITNGPLETLHHPVSDPYFIYDSSNGEFSFAWSSEINGNGQSSDLGAVIVIDKVNNVAFANIGNYTRQEQGGYMQIGSGRTYSNLVAYCFAFSGSGASALISTSVTEPVVDANA